jgi:Tfp pilus assembly protein PilV
MIVAIPIAMLSILILAHGISNSQSYYLAYARSSYLQIKYYSVSQQMLTFLNNENENHSAYLGSVQGLGKFYNVSAEIVNLTDDADCMNSFCRVVQVDGAAKILVIK